MRSAQPASFDSKRVSLSPVDVERLYGAALASTTVSTGFFWISTEPLKSVMAVTTVPICWPFWQTCGSWRPAMSLVAPYVAAMALTLGVLNVWTFLVGHERIGKILLALSLVGRALVVLQDYRFIHNEHYMTFWMTAVYLVLPRDRRALRALIVMFYFWAGLLKLNGAWLSGSALYGLRPLNLPAPFVPLACQYVVILEVVFSWALLSRSRVARWAVFGQLALFHISSFWVVGFFYPLVMAGILAIIPLQLLCDQPFARGPFIVPNLATLTVASLFSLFQLVPRLESAAPAITGEGRFVAVHMFDAPISCRATLTVRRKDGMPGTTRPLRPEYVYPRTACDPLVYFELAKSACANLRTANESDLDLRLESRSPQTTFFPVVDVKDFCSSGVQYSPWHHNQWIHAPAFFR